MPWVDWLVGCFEFNGPLRQYFSLYRTVSQREIERGEKRIDESKNVQRTPTRPFYKRGIGPCPTVIQIVGHLGTGRLPSTIAPPDHPTMSWNEDENTKCSHIIFFDIMVTLRYQCLIYYNEVSCILFALNQIHHTVMQIVYKTKH